MANQGRSGWRKRPAPTRLRPDRLQEPLYLVLLRRPREWREGVVPPSAPLEEGEGSIDLWQVRSKGGAPLLGEV